VVAPQAQHRQPCRPRRHQVPTIVKDRLKRIQYRTDLIDGFLVHTGLSLEPDST
jgi:hypothetical protein